MDLFSTESESGVPDSPRKTIHHYRILVAVDHVLYVADHACQTLRRQPALEHGKLNSLSIFLAHLCNAPESGRSRSFGVSDVVGDQNVHVQARTNGG